MGIYQHKDTGVACKFVGYTTDGFVGLRIGLHNHCISKDKFETYYIKFEPKCGDLLESENFVVKFYHFLGDDYENFLGELVECKSGGKIEGINTFTTEYFRTMSRETSAIITEKLDKLNNLDLEPKLYGMIDLATKMDIGSKHVLLDKEKEEQEIRVGNQVLGLSLNGLDLSDEYGTVKSVKDGFVTVEFSNNIVCFPEEDLVKRNKEKEEQKKEQEEYDFVNPEHYKRGNMEVIDMMKLLWGTEALMLHCEMTAFKYRMRAGTKPDQPIERELEKARWYQEKAKKLRDELR